MNFKGAILFFSLLFGVIFSGLAADESTSHKADISIPDVALLALRADKSSNEFGKAEVAGDRIDLASRQNSKVWLSYSSVRDGQQKRKITATVGGNVPKGIKVFVKAGECTGAGVGELGKSKGLIQLSESPSDIISGIGSCYTGNKGQDGHLLSYDLTMDENQFYQSQNNPEESILTIVYTLTDDN